MLACYLYQLATYYNIIVYSRITILGEQANLEGEILHLRYNLSHISASYGGS